MNSLKNGDIVRLINQGKYAEDENMPIGLITQVMNVYEDEGADLAWARFRGIDVEWFVVLVKAPEEVPRFEAVADRHKRFQYHMNGPYVDE